MKYTKLQKDIEVEESQGCFAFSKGIRNMRSFRIVLTSGVLVEIVGPALLSVSTKGHGAIL